MADNSDQGGYDSAPEQEKPDPDSAEKSDEEILKEAHERFAVAEEAEKEERDDALDDLEFAAGKQWPDEIMQSRQQDGRPCLTINRLPQHIKQVTNDQRQNRPSIKAHPVDDQADPETAKVIQGLIRHIEYNSSADAAYDTAFESAVRSGRGYWRVITQYLSPTSFDQEILIKRIRNRFSVFFDPYSKEPDGSDANFAFITEDISREEYARLYPDSQLAKSGDWESMGNAPDGWMDGKSARIAEYFYKDTQEVTLCQLSDGRVVLKSDLASIPPAVTPDGQVIPPQVVRERRTSVPTIRWCKLNACEVLEKTDWPGSYIPIVPVYGDELDINGKRILKGIVRDAKDPQRMLNFWKSAETETIALAPKAPWLIEEGQIEGYERDWETANRRNHAYLKYKNVSVNGSPIPPPQRQSFEPAVQAITQAAMLAADDLKATTGIYDAALGARSNESSGIAIHRRNVQAQTSNFHFVDNLTRSLKHTGRILLDLIPKIYDTARTARIIGEDGEQKVIKINEQFDQDGKPALYDLSVGKYDITVDVGPSYASKRQEAAASMLDLSKAVPQLVQIAGDLMVKNMDWPGAKEIADRLKKTLPPGLADDPATQNQKLPPEAQAQMQQQGQLIEQLTAKLNEAQDQLQHKRLELESKERMKMAELETQTTIELAKLDARDSIVLLQSQIKQLENQMRILGAGQPIPDITQEQVSQDLAQPDSQGAYPGAEFGDGGLYPTGGESPGQPLEGQPYHDNPNPN